MSKTRPRILYLTSVPPLERGSGAQLRAFHIGRILQSLGDVRLVIASQWPLEEADNERGAASFDVAATVRFQCCKRRRFAERVRHELDPSVLDTFGYEAFQADRKRIRNLIDEHDLVWFHGIDVANGFRVGSCENSVLDVDDLPSRFHYSALANARGIVAKIKLWRQIFIWKRRERHLLDRFTALGVCSDSDKEYLGGAAKIHVIPNGFDAPELQPERTLTSPPRIGFIGTLGYEPNVEGLCWFIDAVWPLVRERVPGCRLRLIGKGSDGEIAGRAESIDGLGWVDDPSEEMATWTFTVVPLLKGAGTRVKIAEAFGRRCPVVSTQLGAFGYNVENGGEMMLADSPSAFAGACNDLLDDPDQGERLAERAAGYFERNLTWATIGEQVKRACEKAKTP